MKNSATLTISPQGQITLPKPWRDQLGLSQGKKILAWIEKLGAGSRVQLEVQPENWVEKYAGSGQGTWGNSVEEIDAAIAAMRSEWNDHES